MSSWSSRWPALGGLALVAFALAPTPQGQPQPDAVPRLAALREQRLRVATKQYDLTWQYYRQDRVETFDVYLWSRLVLDARRAVAKQAAERVAACQEHLDHMKDLESLVRKIRRLGFGRANDVGASEYWRIEAEFWLEEAKAG